MRGVIAILATAAAVLMAFAAGIIAGSFLSRR